MKLFQKAYLYESRGSLRLCPVGWSTRSLGQILEKSCVHSKGHNFDLIFIKQPEYKSTWPCSKLGHLGQKYRSLGQIIENHIEHIRSKFFSHPSLLPKGGRHLIPQTTTDYHRLSQTTPQTSTDCHRPHKNI